MRGGHSVVAQGLTRLFLVRLGWEGAQMIAHLQRQFAVGDTWAPLLVSAPDRARPLQEPQFWPDYASPPVEIREP